MGPLDAIKTCLAKSFQFRGRASRAEFWWFAPFAIGFAVWLTWVVLPRFIDMAWYTKWIVAFFALLPLWAVGARRLQDTGESGADVFIPAGLFFGFPVAAAFLVAAGGAINGLLAFFVLIVVALPLVGFGVVAAFISIGPTLGQMLVPSDPHENKYGPNPNEVPQ